MVRRNYDFFRLPCSQYYRLFKAIGAGNKTIEQLLQVVTTIFGEYDDETN